MKKKEKKVKKVEQEIEPALLEEVRDMVKSIITTVRPKVDAARISQMFFENMPSDYTSQRARRNTLKAKACLENAIVLIRGGWKDFDIPQEVFDATVDDELSIQLRDINEVVEKEICI